MTILEIILVAVALAMDALAISLASAMVSKDAKEKLFSMPFIFAAFQMVMPLLGDIAGGMFTDFIKNYSPFVVFVILAAIGGNMLREGILHIKNPELPTKALTWGLVLMQGLATSIDAFAVGVGFSMIDIDVGIAVSIIGIVTLIICGIGVLVGKKVGEKMGSKAQILGGVILCIIGIKSLFS